MTNNYDKLIGSIITSTSIKYDGELDTITVKCLNGKNCIKSKFPEGTKFVMVNL